SVLCIIVSLTTIESVVSIRFCFLVYIISSFFLFFFFFSSRRRHTRSDRDWSSDVCSSDLWLEVELHDDLRYRLRYGALVEHQNGRRRVRGRSTAYEFRSVEQLRYDFERDVEAALGRLG